MKALMKLKKGEGNVDIQEVSKPKPGPHEVMIEVKTAGICASDIHIYHEDIKIPLKPPVVMGHEFSGVVADVGDNVETIRVGDAVTSETAARICGVCRYCRTGNYNLCTHRRTTGYWLNGAFAKYCVVPGERVHKLPPNIDFASAALCEPLACCVHGALELTGVRAGDTVAVVGPGAVGLLTLQLAKAVGGQVIVCGTSQDRGRLKLAQELGADFAVDVQADDAVGMISDLTQGYGADVVFECSGAPGGARLGLDAVRKLGKYTQIGLFGRPIEIDFEKIAYKEIQVTGSLGSTWTAWKLALRLLSQDKIRTRPLISDVIPLTKWREGFRKHEEKSGVKILLTPVD